MPRQSQFKYRVIRTDIRTDIRAAICASSLVIFAGSAMAVPASNAVSPVKKPATSSAATLTQSKQVTVKSATTAKAPAVPAVPAKKAIIKNEAPVVSEKAEIETAEVETVRKGARSSEPPNEDPTKTVEGNGFFTHETAHTLFLEAKQLMRHNNYNRAIRLLNRAIKLDEDNMEVRVLYAEALDEKLQHQAEKDPEIFNKCIKSWLMVARNEIGDEKGMTFNGLGILSGQYGDEDWSLKAKKRLKVLTGYSPKPWETSDRYLRKVLRSADTSVSAVIKTGATDDEPVKIVKPKAKTED